MEPGISWAYCLVGTEWVECWQGIVIQINAALLEDRDNEVTYSIFLDSAEHTVERSLLFEKLERKYASWQFLLLTLEFISVFSIMCLLEINVSSE